MLWKWSVHGVLGELAGWISRARRRWGVELGGDQRWVTEWIRRFWSDSNTWRRCTRWVNGGKCGCNAIPLEMRDVRVHDMSRDQWRDFLKGTTSRYENNRFGKNERSTHKNEKKIDSNVAISIAIESLSLSVLMTDCGKSVVWNNYHLLMKGSLVWISQKLYGICTACLKECVHVCWESIGVVYFLFFSHANPSDGKSALLGKKILL